MKVIAYLRYARGAGHIHAGAAASCFYIPDMGVVIGTETLGTFGREDVFLTEDEGIVGEAKKVAEKPGQELNIEDRAAKLSDSVVLNVEDIIIKTITKKLREYTELRKQIDASVDYLKERVRK